MTQFPNNPPSADYGHNPYAGGGAPVPAQGQKNTLGLVGFIVSLASLLTCGFAAPIGVILSFIALFKAPRGFAIAGTIIGVVFSGLALVIVLLVGLGWHMVKQPNGIGQQQVFLQQAAPQVQLFHRNNSRLPNEQEFDSVVTPLLQAQYGQFFTFQVDYAYAEASPTQVRLTLAGQDAVLGTGDDQSFLIDATTGMAMPTP